MNRHSLVTWSLLSTLALAQAPAEPSAEPATAPLPLQFTLLDSASPAEKVGEVVDWLPQARQVLATKGDSGFWRAPFDGKLAEGSLQELGQGIDGFDGVTSVAGDPTGRPLVAAALLRKDKPGIVALLNTDTGAKTEIETGFHPDCVRFSHDGRFVLIACEGEKPEEGTDHPGALGVIELDATGQLVDSGVYGFSAPHLAPGLDLAVLRNHVPEQDVALSAEPEYVAETNGTVWVSLQEANALASFDLQQRRWTGLHTLGTIRQLVDASKKDGIRIDSQVTGLPMPDTIAAFDFAGQSLIATANEGDARIDDGDIAKLAEIETLDPENIPPAQREKDALGSLEISRLDGDTDGDGDIDDPTMLGTRSWTLWTTPAQPNAPMNRLWDSGSLEIPLAQLDPAHHNISRDEIEPDDRSDDKGPEPEALATGLIDGDRFVFIGLERQNGILAYRLRGQTIAPELVGYLNQTDQGRISPETLVFLPAEQSPTSKPILIVGYEGGETTQGQVALFGLELTAK